MISGCCPYVKKEILFLNDLRIRRDRVTVSF